MKSRELLKFSERQSLVEITKGNRIEYCVCSYYDDNRPEGSKWDWGHYFNTLEGALKYIVLECFDYKEEIEKEKERLKTIAYNAICFGELEEQHDEDVLLYELGCTQEEYDAIMN